MDGSKLNAQDGSLTILVPDRPGIDEGKVDTWVPLVDLTAYMPKNQTDQAGMRKIFSDNGEYFHRALLAKDYQAKYKELKLECGMEKYDELSFLRIIAALVSLPNFCADYGISSLWARRIHSFCKDILIDEYEQDIWDLYLLQFHHPFLESEN